MFIDIHAHLARVPGPPRGGKQPFCTPEQLIARYDAIGIEKGVVLALVSPEFYTPMTSEEMIDAYERYPTRFIPFCNISPQSIDNSTNADFRPALQWYKERGCRGVGEVTANLPFSDPKVQNLFKQIEEADLPLTFHIAHRFDKVYGLYDDPGLPQLEECLKTFPKLKFLGHSQTFWAEIAALETVGDRAGYPAYPVREEGAVPKLMRRYPNLLGDLSAGSGCNALTRDPEYAVKFLEEFHDRLYFGTDICAPDTPTPLVDFLLDLKNKKHISGAVFEKVARGNAVNLFGL